MTDYTNWKIEKSVINYTGQDEEKQKAAQAAQKQADLVNDWCNQNNYMIDEDEMYYFTTPRGDDKLKEQVRSVRDSFLQETDYTQLPDAPFTAEEKAEYAQYRGYLRDYTKTVNWWESNPKTFEEWEETIDNILE